MLENNLLGKMMPGNGSYGSIDLEESMRLQHHQQHPFMLHPNHQRGTTVQPTIHENFPLTMGTMQSNQTNSLALADVGKGDKSKCVNDEDDPCFTECAGDGDKGKKAIAWHRVKWTDQMVRLLITAVSYIDEEAAAEYGGGARRKYIHLHKKGKWKSISKVMAERGQFVSPQQCEDKFNDLNKRYKRLNEILGRGTSCEVVENPSILDTMDLISEKAKDEVRKILSSKHLHYEEMCSYHNGNRLHLPPDPELQQSLHLALRSRDDHDEGSTRKHIEDDNDDDDQDDELDYHDDSEDNHGHHEHFMPYGIHGGPKRPRTSTDNVGFGNSFECRKQPFSHSKGISSEGNHLSPDGMKENFQQRQSVNQHSNFLEEQKLQIQVQMLELERERLNWERYSRKKDREIELMKLENERMKLENERLALELKRRDS